MRERTHRIGTGQQLAAIAEPTRMAILRRLIASPATLTQLSSALGSYPALVRHHLKSLESVGLVLLDHESVVRNYTEKYYRASASAYETHMLVVADTGAALPITVLGSHDLALEALAGLVNVSLGERTIVPVAIGSLDGLVAMRQGLADVVGCHLFDPEADDYNLPYIRHLLPDRDVIVVTLAHREQGLMLAPGNPLGIREIEDLTRPDVDFVNRNAGSGTRIWLDHRLQSAGLPPSAISGYETVVSTHSDAARTVASGSAHVALGIRAAAIAAGLDFLPLFRERFDLVVDSTRRGETVERLLDELTSPGFGKQVRRIGGYDTAETGNKVMTPA
jgi:molybdate-binding protein